MLSRGFPATTVDEICAAAGVSKGSFYHFFQTKDDIGVAALEGFYAEHMRRLADGPYRGIRDPLERVFGYLNHAEAVAKELWGHGCLLGSFALELGDSHPAMRAKVSVLLGQSAAVLARLFAPVCEKAAGRPGAPKPAELADHFIAMIEGCVVLARAHDDWRRVPAGIRSFKRYLQGLVA